jgi:vacuolar-type H+-ATPase subunit H
LEPSVIKKRARWATCRSVPEKWNRCKNSLLASRNLEVQILQFREEARAELSATRQDLRAEMGEVEARLTERITGGDEETRRQLQDMRTELLAGIDQGDAETRRYMRVLREDVIARIATIGEGRRSHE